MAYCICSPSRSSRWGDMIPGTKGYHVDRALSEAARRGWETRRKNAAWRKQCAMEREAERAAALAAAEAQPMVITGTVPASTVVDAPVAIEVGD